MSDPGRKTAPPQADPFIGRTVDGYRIESVIGRGGMGVVYRATQLSLGRPVAIKVLPEELSGEMQFVERFRREVDVLSRLSHPNVVTVFERGEVDGRQYVVMEYVDGTSLREVMRRGPLAAHQALSIVRSVLAALEHAHDRGIVHRDIKPENVLLAPGGIVKVADFGLSRVRSLEDATRLTHTQLMLGTFEYMAPEQREKAKEADERSDLYATGVVLYEMLAGELPIGRWEPLSEKRPSECDARIDRVVERSLDKSPDRRYQRASEMGDAVSRLLTPAPIAPAPVPPPPARAPAPRPPVAPDSPTVAMPAPVTGGTRPRGGAVLWGALTFLGAAVISGHTLASAMLGVGVGFAVYFLSRRGPDGRRDPLVMAGVVTLLVVLAGGVLLAAALFLSTQRSASREEMDAARTLADAQEWDARAWDGIQRYPHGVLGHWIGDREPGVVEKLSQDRAAIGWLAGVLQVDLSEAAQYRLASYGKQILIFLPRKGDPNSRPVQAAFGKLLREALGDKVTVQPVEVEDEAFRARLAEAAVPEALRMGGAEER